MLGEDVWNKFVDKGIYDELLNIIEKNRWFPSK